jgi:hypothetical protein
MMNTSRPFRRTRKRWLHDSRFVVAIAIAAAGISGSGRVRGAAAQAPAPCSLLTADEIQPLAPSKASVGNGVPTSLDVVSFSTCRYTWGAGVDRVKLDVTVNDASRMFSGMSPDQIKQGLQASITTGTADAVIPDVGDAAMFKADSPVFVHATAFIHGRILRVLLEGFEAREKKDQVIALTKSAASRL